MELRLLMTVDNRGPWKRRRAAALQSGGRGWGCATIEAFRAKMRARANSTQTRKS